MGFQYPGSPFGPMSSPRSNVRIGDTSLQQPSQRVVKSTPIGSYSPAAGGSQWFAQTDIDTSQYCPVCYIESKDTPGEEITSPTLPSGVKSESGPLRIVLMWFSSVSKARQKMSEGNSESGLTS